MQVNYGADTLRVNTFDDLDEIENNVERAAVVGAAPMSSMALQAQILEQEDGRSLRKEEVPEAGPLSRSPLSHRLVSDEGGSTPPGHLAQLPLSPPPGQVNSCFGIFNFSLNLLLRETYLKQVMF